MGSQEPGTQYRSPLWVPGTQLLEPFLLFLSVFISQTQVRSWTWKANPATLVREVDILTTRLTTDSQISLSFNCIFPLTF